MNYVTSKPKTFEEACHDMQQNPERVYRVDAMPFRLRNQRLETSAPKGDFGWVPNVQPIKELRKKEWFLLDGIQTLTHI